MTQNLHRYDSQKKHRLAVLKAEEAHFGVRCAAQSTNADENKAEIDISCYYSAAIRHKRHIKRPVSLRETSTVCCHWGMRTVADQIFVSPFVRYDAPRTQASAGQWFEWRSENNKTSSDASNLTEPKDSPTFDILWKCFETHVFPEIAGSKTNIKTTACYYCTIDDTVFCSMQVPTHRHGPHKELRVDLTGQNDQCALTSSVGKTTANCGDGSCPTDLLGREQKQTLLSCEVT